MRFIVPILFTFLLITSCKPEDERQKIVNQVKNLETVEQKQEFLKEIYMSDQRVRNQQQEATRKFGYKSQQELEALDKMMSTDKLNLMKIEAFLDEHGYPKKEELGGKAPAAPWLIIHHAASGNDIRRKYFPMIYEAYERGDVNGGALSLYLYRMYNIQSNGGRVEWDRPFTEEEEIDTMLQLLNLQKSLADIIYQ